MSSYMLLYIVSFLPCEAVPVCTGCNLLKRFVLCTTDFWWHFLLYFVNKFVEGFSRGFPPVYVYVAIEFCRQSRKILET